MFNCDVCNCKPDTLHIVKLLGKRYCLCPDCHNKYLQKEERKESEDFKRDYCAICCDGGGRRCLGCDLQYNLINTLGVEYNYPFIEQSGLVEFDSLPTRRLFIQN